MAAWHGNQWIWISINYDLVLQANWLNKCESLQIPWSLVGIPKQNSKAVIIKAIEAVLIPWSVDKYVTFAMVSDRKIHSNSNH